MYEKKRSKLQKPSKISNEIQDILDEQKNVVLSC